MRNKIMIGVCAIALSALAAGCTDTANTNGNSNAVSNSNATTAINTNNAAIVESPTNNTAPPPVISGDYSTTTGTDANGVRTETRTYRNNSRISKVVITTRNGKQTARVYSATGQEKDVSNRSDLDELLRSSGDKIADAAGFVKDKTVDAAKATGSGAKTVGEKTVEGGKTVIEKTVDGSKKVGEKTAEGAKKTGSAIKKAVTP